MKTTAAQIVRIEKEFRLADARYLRARLHVDQVRAERLRVMVRMVDAGISHERIADLANCARATITQQLSAGRYRGHL